MKKNENNRHISLKIFEESLANAMTGGAARYNVERTYYRVFLALNTLVLAFAIIIAILETVGGVNLSGDALVMASFGPLAVCGLSLGFFYISEQFRFVRSRVNSLKRTLLRAEEAGLLAAMGGSWGYDLKGLLERVCSCANDAAAKREGLESKIDPAAQRKAAHLKKIIGQLMTLGRLVEERLRIKECDGALNLWSSPVKWPGEKAKRSYLQGVLVGRQPTFA